MEITPKGLTIGQLFALSNEQFIIPTYQRRYAWQYNQYGAMFDDIKTLGNNDKHLFGTVLFHSGFYKGGLQTPAIIDGQQRITTLSLLLLAIRNRFVELKNDKQVDDVNKFLESKDYDEKVRNKLILGDLDNPDYDKIINSKNNNVIINKNLINAYGDFITWLRNDFTIKDLNQFFFKLQNNCVIIRLDINDAKNVYKLFEVINNRGLRLSATDIIKNFILGHASELGEKILNEAKQLWTDVIINLDNINTDNFFRQYLASVLKRKITSSKLASEFKNYYKKNVEGSDVISEFSIEDEFVDEDEEIEISNNGKLEKSKIKKVSLSSFLTSIKNSSKIYSNIINKDFKDSKINNHLYDLERIQSFPSTIFLLDLFSRKLQDKVNYIALNQIKTFMIRRNICESRTGELDSIFSRLCKLPNDDINKNIKLELLDNIPEDEAFLTYFQKHQFKGKNKERAKYILEQMEYHLTDNKNEYVINSSDEVHLEHIMPLKITTKKFRDWISYLGADCESKHKRYVWRIGNLTLLSDELNIGASNNPFTKKKKFYKKSALRLNKQIVDSYRQFRFNKQEERSAELAKVAIEIWKL